MVLLAALALTVSAGSALGGRPTDRSTNPVSCTHGASSLGPISLLDGAGDPAPPAPATEACLP
jgi:hypothetical protein